MSDRTLLMVLGCSAAINALLICMNEFMINLRIARDMRMRLLEHLDYGELARYGVLALVLGLLIIPTLATIFTIGRTFLRWSWTGDWK